MKDTRLLLAGLLAAVLLAIVLLKSPGNGPNSFRPGAATASFSQTDANGVAWVLDRSGGITIVQGPDGPKPGAPIFVKTDVQQIGEREVSIGLILEGQASEQYRPPVKKNGSPLPVPRVRIVNEAGQVIGQESFQYG
jgi:hypothetical protein